MDIQYEIDGSIVESAELEEKLGDRSRAQNLEQIVARIVQDVERVCDQHGEGPAITIIALGTHLTGVRVAGCCPAFVEQVQTQVEAIFDEQTPRLLPAGTQGMILIVRVVGTEKTFVFDVARIQQLVIGRYDPSAQYHPDIDLSSYGAYDSGVSRRHATIVLAKHGFFLIDEGSPNGTFLNEQRIAAKDPCPLKFGDQIRIGRLVLEVTLDYPPRPGRV